MPVYYQVEFELLEDLHTGTGSGNALTDAVLMRDRQGRPVIRATHVRGVLLEKAKELKALEQCTEKECQALFGAEGHGQRGALSLTSFYQKADQKTAQPLIWTSSSRQLGKRNPQEKTLRSREYIPAGTRFSGQIMLRHEDTRGLFEDCLRLMDRLGAERQRGSGLVRVHYQCLKPEEAPLKFNDQKPAEDQKPIVLRLVWRNLEALSLPVVGYTGNIIPTESYIRGQTLWGALIEYLKNRGHNPSFLLQYEAGQISIGNAYPLPASMNKKIQEQDYQNLEQWQVLPFPLALKNPKPSADLNKYSPWWTDKGSRLDIINELIPIRSKEQNTEDQSTSKEKGKKSKKKKKDKQSKNTSSQKKQPQEKLKRPKDREFLFALVGHQWERYQPQILDHMRNQIPEKRTVENQGHLFTMEEIAEDTLFLSDFIFYDQQAYQQFVTDFADLLNGLDWLSIGRGGRPLQLEKAQLIPLNTGIRQHQSNKVVTLLCTSDWIIRSTQPYKNGNHFRLPNLGFCDRLDLDLLIAQLEQQLGETIETTDWQWRVTCDEDYSRSYNILTHAHRDPSLTIRRGSMMRIEGQDLKPLIDALSQVHHIGERWWEGYGRFQWIIGEFPKDKLNVFSDNKKRKKKKNNQQNNTLNTKQQANLPVNRREEILLKVKELYKQYMNQEGPSSSQWQDFLSLVQFSSPVKAIDTMAAHSQQLSGFGWKSVNLAALKKEIESLADDEQRLFLEALVRYIVLDLKNKKEEKST